jgi:UDP:flavonoid glycosyltransferase YjiC (YdhE family)
VRVLVCSTRGTGHIGPLVPFARACLAAGDDVLVCAPDESRAIVEATGLPFRGFGDPPAEETGPLYARAPDMAPDDVNAMVIAQIFAGIFVRAALPRLAETFAEWRPDAVLRDPAEFASALLAERHGLPCPRVAVSLAASEELALGWAADVLGRWREELALAPDPGAARLAASPWLTTVPASVEAPGHTGPAATHRFHVGEDGAPPLPEWWPGREGPLVYLSFGSVAPTVGAYPRLYRVALDALDGLEARILVTVGRGQDPAELGPLPAGVHVEPWIPQAEVMAHAAAMVGHGGFGSTVGALVAGVPQVLVPIFADQPANAARVAALGAGVALAGPWAAAEELRPAVERVLADPAFADAAAAVAAEGRALPPVTAAPDVVRALA